MAQGCHACMEISATGRADASGLQHTCAQRPRVKVARHVSLHAEAWDMLDAMAQEDAPPGDKPDRSRLIGQLVAREWARRGKPAKTGEGKKR